LGDFGQKLSPQNQLDICFLTVWEQDWLGMAKLKNVLRSTQKTIALSCYGILKISYFLLTD